MMLDTNHPDERKSLTYNTVYHTVCVTYYMVNSSSTNGEIFENLKLELRRGCLIVAVLAQLRVERYGYTLRKALADDGLEIDEGTLYPLLRRLETQGMLVSEWREEGKRRKRFYRLSADGVVILEQLLDEWKKINASLDRILQEV
jgi:PadR family transcriptional regulator PadR